MSCKNCPNMSRKNVIKGNEILVEDFFEQCSVIKGLLHGLRDAMLKRAKFTMFLELVNIHAEKGVVPPGVRINIKPPGFEEGDFPDVWMDWNSHVYKCSWEFVNILKYHYKKEIQANQWLKDALARQCIDAITMHRRCKRQTAAAFVGDWIEKFARMSVNAFTDLFRRESCGACSSDFYRFIECEKFNS